MTSRPTHSWSIALARTVCFVKCAGILVREAGPAEKIHSVAMVTGRGGLGLKISPGISPSPAHVNCQWGELSTVNCQLSLRGNGVPSGPLRYRPIGIRPERPDGQSATGYRDWKHIDYALSKHECHSRHSLFLLDY